ncbi:DUF1481 domain-containing protein [Enterobacteriaceae bacterium ESL0689]|nr:DUF1481 domain-containing protein [Enterobacteriaceae bacterium ESL0689]
MYGFYEGALGLLLSAGRYMLTSAAVISVLAGCSQHNVLPSFTASGYADDQGAVRIWRKDNQNEVHLLAISDAWNNGETSTSEYRWQGTRLTFIELNTSGKPAEHIRVHFDERGELSFMQREIDGQKFPLSDDQVALYRYRATHIRQTSDALYQGRVTLHQGYWRTHQTITTCEGQTVSPAFDDDTLAYIASRQHRAAQAISVAWLESSDGVQLLMVDNSDFCARQPQEKTF